ncbi:rCG48934 [Rattus norvegicus]|uniref:RCG48934 n=1 Tax=Rattus norvegicus TaxID=10116 RepID=A6IFW5_RAT|nr:rCG48934 [Rattus norvegicus]
MNQSLSGTEESSGPVVFKPACTLDLLEYFQKNSDRYDMCSGVLKELLIPPLAFLKNSEFYLPIL